MKKTENVRWGKSMVTTIIMILLVVAASFGAINYIGHTEEEKCFEMLYQEADNLGDTIVMYAKSDRKELRMLASVIAKYEEPDDTDLWDLLDSYTTTGMMSRIELLLPDNTVLVQGGTSIDARGTLSFEKESALGEHITDRETDLRDSGSYIVRHYVPVIREGKTVAMLYGVIELGSFPEDLNMKPYSGKGALYIIDGSTGDFLVDTWHSGDGGNIWEMGKREMAPGYDPQQMKQGLTDGDSRYVVFVSRTAGEYLYFYYKPLEINHWRIAVSVPESVVFESADEIERILNCFLLFELCCFIVYFLWMIRYVRKVTGEKQRQLETINNIYDVEKLLFNAHEKEENINAALEKIGGIMQADKAGFWIVEQSWGNAAFLWEKEQPAEKHKENVGKEHISRLLTYFLAGNSELEVYSEKALRRMFPEMKQNGLVNLAAIPVEDLEGKICGILEACNIKNRHSPTTLLKNMKFSFGMFCHNLEIYTQIQEQGSRDALTGLYNRNRYESDLLRIYAEHKAALACVYIDVNGLHEMNNASGHDTGDKMLRTVAREIRKCFDTEYSYRFGGDEFIIFIPGTPETIIKKQSEAFTAALVREDYHVSLGIQYETEVSSMAALIKAAEKKMYFEKKRYYEQETHDRRRGLRDSGSD